jgi:hypothetical protein
MPDLSPRQAVGALVALIAIMVTFLIGTAVFGGVASVSTGGGLQAKIASPLVEVGDAVSFQDVSYFAGEVVGITQVNDSTGRALQLRGAPDSTYQSSGDIQFASDETWTVEVHTAWNQSFRTTNGTVYSLDGRVLLQYDNASQQWIGWYYDESTTSSHRVEIPATSQPGSLQAVHLVANGSHFAIYRNNTRGEVENLSVAGSEDPLLNASNWAGRQDELTGFDDALNASQRQHTIDNPVLPLNGANRTFRVMFDEGGSSLPVYFTAQSLSLSNTSFRTGVPGTVLSRGADYAVDAAEGTITALAGGRLDTAPTVFVSYDLQPNQAAKKLTDDIANSFELFAILPVAIVGLLVMGAINRLQE